MQTVSRSRRFETARQIMPKPLLPTGVGRPKGALEVWWHKLADSMTCDKVMGSDRVQVGEHLAAMRRRRGAALSKSAPRRRIHGARRISLDQIALLEPISQGPGRRCRGDQGPGIGMAWSRKNV